MNEYVRRDMVEAVRLATLAPSTHNTQPWKFAIRAESVDLNPDFFRRLPTVDPKDRELYISLGCALENLVIALRNLGYHSEVQYLLNGPDEDCIRVHFKKNGEPVTEGLFGALYRRQTNRSEFEPYTLGERDLEQLRSIALEPGVTLTLSDQKPLIAKVIRLVMDSDEVQMSGKGFRTELERWIRFNATEARRLRDGLGSESIGMPTGPRWLGTFFLEHTDLAAARAERDKRLLESSPAIAIFSTNEDTKSAWINAGRSFERVALWATTLEIQHAHMNQPIEVPDMRAMLARVLEIPLHYPQLLLRLGCAKPMPYSLRRPVEDVLLETEDTLLLRKAN